MEPSETLTWEDVVLRRARPAFATELYEVIEDGRPHIAAWMPWAVEQTYQDTVDFLAKATGDWESGEAYNYSIFVADRLVGGISLMTRRGPGCLEIGYWLHPAAVGRGTVTKASRALLDVAFAMPGIDRVEILHDAGNTRSGAVPARLGFTEVERMPTDRVTGNHTGLDVLWRLTRSGATVS
ncbi:GNAT family N-acetyltransferase [Longispora sp. K20-0274]|uniref:GNAT family N-acetyltransferase n=1 Tax=Longispora sp. K20-0274 TaxID=3088255 RepID=UPI00399C351F